MHRYSKRETDVLATCSMHIKIHFLTHVHVKQYEPNIALRRRQKLIIIILTNSSTFLSGQIPLLTCHYVSLSIYAIGKSIIIAIDDNIIAMSSGSPGIQMMRLYNHSWIPD